MPALDKQQAATLIKQRHKHYQSNRVRWQWLLDSLEGGECYRNATYGNDSRGMPVMNLIRHKREYPLPNDRNGQFSGMSMIGTSGQDATVLAGEDDFELRRARTVVPPVFERAIRMHIARIFSREIRRTVLADELPGTTPSAKSLTVDEANQVTRWWADVDGSGSMPVDKWMRQVVAPVFFALGQLDVLFDRPKAPEGSKVQTQADVTELGLDRVHAAIVMPDRVLNWKCDCHGNYEWVLIEESHEEPDGTEQCRYRHWTATDSVLYDEEGNVIEAIPHPYGRPPVVRIFDRRDLRCKNIGRSNYETIADLMRSIYNRASELVLSDTQQAFPILQAPSEMLNGSEGMPVGPGWVLPMVRSMDGSYQGLEAVGLPTGSIDSLRTNILSDRAEADREAGLVKPAGSEQGGVTGQSGLSKWFDHKEGSDLLSARAESLADAERQFVRLALTVSLGRPIDSNTAIPVEVAYPTEFSLLSAEDLVNLLEALDKATAQIGTLPALQALLLKRFAREAVRGETDQVYHEIDEEIDAYVLAKAAARLQAEEIMTGRNSMITGEQTESESESESDPESESETETETDALS